MKHKQHFLLALVAPLVMLITALSAHSRTASYDMSRLLAEPHPFLAAATAQIPPPIVTLQPSGAHTYTTPGSVIGVVLQGQPYTASVVNRAVSPQPTHQGAGESMAPGSSPGSLAFPMPTPIPATQARPISITQVPAKKTPVQVDQISLQSDDPILLTFGVGFYDINDNQGAAEFRVEWKFKKLFWNIHPFIGLMGTSDAAGYGYAGVAMDWFLEKSWVITPSFAAGVYRDGDGKDLGHAIEFRSSLEVAYRFQNNHRLGLSIYHLSNASLSDNNPGSEVLSLGLSIPFD